jgi:hypothetical protein
MLLRHCKSGTASDPTGWRKTARMEGLCSPPDLNLCKKGEEIFQKASMFLQNDLFL